MPWSAGRVLRFGRCRQPKQPFAAPDANDAGATRVPAINDAEGRVDQFAQEGLAKLWNDPPDVEIVGEDLCAPKDLGDEPVANLWYALRGVPLLDARQVAEGGLGEVDFGGGHGL